MRSQKSPCSRNRRTDARIGLTGSAPVVRDLIYRAVDNTPNGTTDNNERREYPISGLAGVMCVHARP